MNLTFSPEQEDLRKSVRRFFEEKSPESEVRRLAETAAGYDAAVWAQMSQQLGLQAIAIPEEYGGAGYGYVELGLVFEEMGRALLCGPFLSTVGLAAAALVNTDDEHAKKEHLPAIAAGETTATLAVTEDPGSWQDSKITMPATRTRGAWTLTGTKNYVLDGHTGDIILVLARTEAGLSLFSVPGNAPGLARTPLVTMDQTRKQARLEFTSTPAQLIGTDGHGWSYVSKALDLAAVVLAAEEVGGAQRVLEMSVEYAKTRVQFGRPIGSFQAIKHKCADMLVLVESAKSAAYYAMWSAAEDSEDLGVAASMAKAYCSEAYLHVAAENIQVHGGIGFTWEHPAHLYFKRAKTDELYLGTPNYHRELLAQRLGL